jgi:hypothetical protein
MTENPPLPLRGEMLPELAFEDAADAKVARLFRTPPVDLEEAYAAGEVPRRDRGCGASAAPLSRCSSPIFLKARRMH